MQEHSTPDDRAEESEPSYAGLAQRLRKLPQYQKPELLALLDQLEAGTIDSEECVTQLGVTSARLRQEELDREKLREQLATAEESKQTDLPASIDAEVALNRYADEPTIISEGDEDTEEADEDAKAEENTPPRSTTSPVSTAQTGSAPTSGGGQTQGAYSRSGLTGSSGSYDAPVQEAPMLLDYSSAVEESDEEDMDLDFED